MFLFYGKSFNIFTFSLVENQTSGYIRQSCSQFSHANFCSLSSLVSSTFCLVFCPYQLFWDPSHTPCVCINCFFNPKFPVFFTLIRLTRFSRLSVLEGPCFSSIHHINIICICFLDLKQLKSRLSLISIT